MSDIESWLDKLGLKKYATTFNEAEIDFPTLLVLVEEDLKELGLPLGPRRRIWDAIGKHNGGTASAVEPGAASSEASVLAENSLAGNAPDSVQNEAERRHLTVMFVDLVGSTELSTRIDAEDVRDVITEFQNTVAGVISRFEGFVARYMGDGVLCYFGWPRANEDDAERAVRAGLSIIDRVKKSSTPDGTALATRVGIASGLVIVGDLIGSGASEEAAVVGETPNLAARLQSLAEPDQLVLPEHTRKLLNDGFTLESTGLHSLKGITEPLEAFVVTGETARESRFQAHNTNSMTPLVGRDQELDQIRAGWVQAVEGHGQMILVSGEAGIGKSRIVQAAIDEIKQYDAVRITFQCSPYHAESAFYPIIHQMQFAAKITASDTAPIRLQKLSRLGGVSEDNIPLLAAMLGIDASAGYQLPELSPAQLRARTMDAQVDTLVQQAQHKPLLLVFEDLHWIDPTTLEFLELAIDAIGEKRIFLLATARPTFTHAFGGHPDVRRFALNRLGHQQVLSIVGKLTGGKALPDEVLQIITDRTDGVPLFVEELTKTIIESGVLKSSEDEYYLDGQLNVLAIPNTLHDSLMARLDRLQPIKEVAQTAACIGREFSHHLLAQVAGLSEEQLASALEGLIAAELIYRRGVPPEARYQFKHALVRDAAYESLLKPRRRGIHSSILMALESDSTTAPEVLATHAEAAEMTDRAIELWEAASKAAVVRPAFEEGILHLERALSLIDPQVNSGDGAATQQALTLQAQLGVACMARRGWGGQETKAAFEKALVLANKVGDTPLLFSILYGLMTVRYVRAEHAEAVHHGQEFVEIAEQSRETAPAVVANRAFGVALLFSGQYSRSQKHMDRTLELFDEDKHLGLAKQYGQDLGVASHGFISTNYHACGASEKAHKLFRTCERYAQISENTMSICYMHMVGMINSLIIRDEPELERHTTALFTRSSKHQLAFLQHLSGIFMGLLSAGRGDATGLDQVRSEDKALQGIQNLALLAASRGEAARRAISLGLYQQADDFIRAAREHTEEKGEYFFSADLYRVEAQRALADGNAELAEQRLLKSIEVAVEQGTTLWEIRAAIDYAQVKLKQNQSNEALMILRPTFNRITDGNCPQERKRALQLFDDLCG